MGHGGRFRAGRHRAGIHRRARKGNLCAFSTRGCAGNSPFFAPFGGTFRRTSFKHLKTRCILSYTIVSNALARSQSLCYTAAEFGCSERRIVTKAPGCDPASHAANRGQTIGRVDVSEPASISSGIAARYATAIFELAKEAGTLAKLEANLDDLSAALGASADLRAMIASPVLSRTAQGAAIAAIADKMGLVPELRNGLALMAAKRRLFVLPQLVARLGDMIAEDKGEVRAEVTTAMPLSKKQADTLVKTLKARIGRDVKLNATVDESLIGGLVVKVGSKMIDTSIRSRLDSLQNAMKEVG
ncbi:MAG: F0F1 ATP synthase subunit delta [Roseovarius sp.]|nr:F0F1 ATP synthase subunit delta [Roseovarius sp.]